jgi:hypothetical protein
LFFGPLAILACLLAGGCATSVFDQSFDQLARDPVDAGQPIVGAWQGEWTNVGRTAGGPARLVVDRRAGAGNGPVTDTFTLELGNFFGYGQGRRFTAEATVDPRGGPVRDFTAKVPVVIFNDLCAAALGLQAHADGNAMTVQYWVSDALQQVDAGRVDLRRAEAQTEEGPATRR